MSSPQTEKDDSNMDDSEYRALDQLCDEIVLQHSISTPISTLNELEITEHKSPTPSSPTMNDVSVSNYSISVSLEHNIVRFGDTELIKTKSYITNDSTEASDILSPTSNVATPNNHLDDDEDQYHHHKTVNINNDVQKHSNHRKWRKLFLNPLYYTRFIILIFSFIPFILSSAYCFAQLLNVELDLITECDPKTNQQIWNHSFSATTKYEYGQINEETQFGQTNTECITTNKYQINTDRLWYSNYFKVNYTSNINAKCILFGIVAIYCIVIIIYVIFTIIMDAMCNWNDILFTKSDFFDIYLANNANSNTKTGEYSLLVMMKSIYKYIGIGSFGWIIMMFMSEMFEIILQSQALMLYNGYNVFDSDVYLANKPHFILLFTTIISCNCFASGILWLSYSLYPSFCYGFIFKISIFFVDQFADLFYSIFPLIVVMYDDYNRNTHKIDILCAQLNIDSNLAFISTYVPLILLCNKCLLLTIASTKNLRDEYYNEWKLLDDISKQSNDKKVVYKAHLRGFNVNHTALAINKGEIYDSNGKSTVPFNSIKKPIIHKKSMVFISLLYIAYGIALLYIVNTYINTTQQYCELIKEDNYFMNINGSVRFNHKTLSKTERDLLHCNPQLFLWDKCLYKIYPFTTNYRHKCQCRVMVIENWNNLTSSTADRKQYLNLTQKKIITGMLQHWVMLEKFKTDGSEDIAPTPYHIASSFYSAPHLKAFEWRFARIESMEDGISNWNNLEYLKLEEIWQLTKLPHDFGELNEIKHLTLIQTGLVSFSTQICDIHRLEVLQFQKNRIESIPHCISELQSLRQLLVDSTITLSKIPLSIFNLSHLFDLSVFEGNINYPDLLSYNVPNNTHINLDEWFERSLHWNEGDNVHYYLQNNPICDASNSSMIPHKLQYFLANIAECIHPCSYQTVHDSKGAEKFQFCQPLNYADGICDSECNSPMCAFDGGDCVQGCFAPPQLQNYTNCTWNQFINDQCDQGCNNKYCAGYQYASNFQAAFGAHVDDAEMNTDMFHCSNPSIQVVIFDAKEGTLNGCHSDDSGSTYVDRNNAKQYKGCMHFWVGDGLCDDGCRSHVCNYDSGDCDLQCTDNYCADVFNAWNLGKAIAYGVDANDIDVLNNTFFCEIFWVLAASQYNINGNVSYCYEQFYIADYNADQYLNFKEFIPIAIKAVTQGNGVWNDRSTQINCSMCVGMEHYNECIDPMNGSSLCSANAEEEVFEADVVCSGIQHLYYDVSYHIAMMLVLIQ